VADYTPVFVAGEIVTLTASTAITGGAPLVVSGSGTVAPLVPSATPATNMIGVASADTVSGGRAAFYCRGPVHESIADGTITAGDQIVTATNASRHVRTLAVSAADLGAAYAQATVNAAVNLAVNNARSVVGVALTTASDNTKVRWMMYV
jgi:hypothetical protein